MNVRKSGYAHLTPSPRCRLIPIGQTRPHGRSSTLPWLLSAGPPYPNDPAVESSRVAPGLLN